jgi:ligand-binding sensor domain-containing protein
MGNKRTLNNSDQMLFIPASGKAESINVPSYTGYDRSLLRELINEKDFILFSVRNKLVRLDIYGRIQEVSLPVTNIYCANQDENNYYIGTENTGCFKISKTNFENATPELIFKGSITGIEIDYEGGFWFSTYEEGLFYSVWTSALTISEEDGLASSNVTYLNYRNGILFAGHPIRFFSEIDSTVEVHKNRLWSLFDLNNGNWFCNSSVPGTLKLDNKNNYNGIKDTLRGYNSPVNFPISCLLENGKLVFSNHYRIVFYDSQKLERIDSVLAPFWVDVIAEKNNELLIGTSTGLYKLKGHDFISVNDKDERFKTPISAISVLADESYFVGTKDAGLFYCKGNSIIKEIAAEQGLLSSSVRCIIPRADGNIWIGTSAGLQLLSPNFTVLVNINSKVGLPENEVNDVVESGDTVWVATSGGIFKFQLSKMYNQRVVPRLYINQLLVDGKPRSISELPSIEFNYKENNIKIAYTGVSLRGGTGLLYRYKLKINDAKWNYTTATELDFPQLSPGEYFFVVQVQSVSGIWSTSQVLSFTITPPFWQLFWVKGITVALIVVLLIQFFIIFRKRQVIKQEKQLAFTRQLEQLRLQALQAQMNPHFMFNVMGSIQHFILNNDADNASSYLTRFSRLLRNVLEHSSHERITFDQEIETLRLYLQLESLRMERFSFEISCDKKLTPISILIPPMIIQPYVENAIWHGLKHKKNERKFFLRFKLGDENQLIVEVEDNGVGRKAAGEIRARNQLYSHNSKGMVLIEQRIKAIHHLYAQLITVRTEDLFDVEGNASGTRVTLIIQNG